MLLSIRNLILETNKWHWKISPMHNKTELPQTHLSSVTEAALVPEQPIFSIPIT